MLIHLEQTIPPYLFSHRIDSHIGGRIRWSLGIQHSVTALAVFSSVIEPWIVNHINEENRMISATLKIFLKDRQRRKNGSLHWFTLQRPAVSRTGPTGARSQECLPGLFSGLQGLKFLSQHLLFPGNLLATNWVRHGPGTPICDMVTKTGVRLSTLHKRLYHIFNEGIIVTNYVC